MGLFDSTSKSSSTGTSKGTSKGNTDSSLVEAITNVGKSSTAKGGVIDKNILTLISQALPEEFKKFSKENAIADSQGAVDSIVSRIIDAGLPDIRTGATVAGGYNSTTSRIMKDNLVAQAAKAGAEVQQKTIADYADRQLAAVQQLLSVAALDQDANIINTVAEDQNRVAKEEIDEDRIFDTTETGQTRGTSKESVFGQLTKAVTPFINPAAGIL